ncbi:MAG: hypothetical protein KKC85_04875 [Gammaproteobacteria bacterium]|nr:hypothetical protein [Gammaproteobacteria bacterium]MBU1530533.1 hypothetical protein [Gammaproteobacteria bacterium]MBU2285750.1 hypothetical protein [Gammaproteobacteria bacterium]
MPRSFEDDLADIVASIETCAVDEEGRLVVPMADRRRNPEEHQEEASAFSRNWLELIGAERQLPQALYALWKVGNPGLV